MRKLENHWSITSLVHNSKLFLICSANQFQRLFSHIKKKITVGIIFTLVSLLKHLKRGSQIFLGFVCLFVYFWVFFFYSSLFLGVFQQKRHGRVQRSRNGLQLLGTMKQLTALGQLSRSRNLYRKQGPPNEFPSLPLWPHVCQMSPSKIVHSLPKDHH